MKRGLAIHRRSLALMGALVPLLALFVYVVLRSGPLAPVEVVVTTVESQVVAPALFAIGTVEARYTYKVGPTVAGRVRRVEVDVGDAVEAGQVLAEMEPIDLDERVSAQQAALGRAEAAVATAAAQARESQERLTFAAAQERRFEKLLEAGITSQENLEVRRQDRQVGEAALAAASANLEAAERDTTRLRAERDGSIRQRANLRLLAPAAGLVVARRADPGTTVVAGSAVIEVIDPAGLWVHVRFDQASSAGLRPDLPAQVALRSRPGALLAGRVLRLEPLADAVTEEALAKVVFDVLPEPLPAIGEQAEVTVALRPLPPRPTIPNASLQFRDGEAGVWRLADGDLRFAPVRTGATDLDGRVQILEGLEVGDRVVVYSQRALEAGRRIKVVDRLKGGAR